MAAVSFEEMIARALQGDGIDVSLEEMIAACGLPLEDELGSAAEVESRVTRFGLTFAPGFGKGGMRTRRVLKGPSKSVYDVKALLERQDEGSLLELKSSMVLDWNRKTATGDSVRSDGVVHSLLKSICGLANSDGGLVLVGVDDKKRIVGIDGDFDCGIANSDQWMLQLSSFLNGRLLNGERVDPYVSTSIVLVEGLQVALISVVARKDLTFLKSEDGKRWEYFCRLGNKTVRIDIESFEEHLLRKRGY